MESTHLENPLTLAIGRLLANGRSSSVDTPFSRNPNAAGEGGHSMQREVNVLAR